MTDDINREAVMRRVQKLLAIAQDHRANPNEASAAASQAEKIMRKYQLDMAELLMPKIATGEDLDTGDVICTAKTNGTRVDKVPPWASWIAFNLAQLHECGYRYARVTTGKGVEVAVRFYGYKADVQVACWTLEYLSKTVNNLCTAFRGDPRYLIGGRSVMDSYRKGVASGICSLLREAKAAKVAEMQAMVKGRALMVCKAQAIAERYGEFEYSSNKTTTSSVNAFATGVEVGRKVDVHRRGVGHTGNPQERLQ